ncbi:low-density lipoprotein receptor-related protein 2-like [Watersipora subatra]|uniref:low-density lipoprotein receptor-related protein 2-like n=1 Tax=Watersipora subatra TaxID=2589382 RepID=UPI00355ADB12
MELSILFIRTRFFNTVTVINLDGPDYYRAILLGHTGDMYGVGRPTSMCVDPTRGKLYWIDIGATDVPQKIASMNLDGSGAEILWTDSLHHVDELTIDIERNRLFWTNAGMRSIQMLDLNRQPFQPVNVIDRIRNLSHPIGIAYYQGRLYYTDYTVQILASVSAVENATDTQTIRFGITDLHQIHVYEHARHLATGSPCAEHNCEHICVSDAQNVSKCLCGAGYRLVDGKCEMYESFVLATLQNEVHGYPLNSSDQGEAIAYFGSEGDESADVHIAPNVKERLVYWTDQSPSSATYGINVFSIDTAVNKHLIGTKLGGIAVTGIVYDWISGYLYFANHLSETSLIEVMKKDATLRTIIYQTVTERPHQLTIDPINRYIYWTDIGAYPKIARMHLDGSNLTAIITQGIFSPSTVHCDPSSNKIYWAELQSGIIYSANSDGTEREELTFSSSVTGITVFNSQLIWADSNHRQILSLPLSEPSPAATVVRGRLRGLVDIAMFDASLQVEAASPCSDMNGGCEQLCFAQPGMLTARCGCSSGTLAGDQATCEDVGEYLLYSTMEGIHSLSLTGDLSTPTPYIERNFVHAFDIDYKRDQIYFIESSSPEGILAVGLEGTGLKNISTNFGRYFLLSAHLYASLTYDWLHDRIYYSVLGDDKGIFIIDSDGSNIHKISSSNAYDIVVHPCERYIFWSFQVIRRANLAGNEVNQIVTDTWFVYGLTIDWIEEKLYYVDYIQEIMARVDYTGLNKEIIMTNLMVPYRLAVYNELVYWSDDWFESVNVANKFTGSGRQTLYENRDAPGGSAYDVQVFDRNQTRCMAKNQCNFNNGAGCCSGGAKCYSSSSGAAMCRCNANHTLVNNKQQCVPDDKAKCDANEFTCPDGTCISWNLRCDGINDCKNGEDEDEAFCMCNPCEAGEFVCDSGECILSSLACNKIPNCKDGSDENDDCVYAKCPRASDFQCEDLRCISNHSVCDGVLDCFPDHTDEQNGCEPRECETGYASCATYPLCIIRFSLCDNIVDCADGSDESPTHCQKVKNCLNEDIQCDNRCLPAAFHCDGQCDCSDCSDEPNELCNTDRYDHDLDLTLLVGPAQLSDTGVLRECYGNLFKCNGTSPVRCISPNYVCDGENDCQDGSDESYDAPTDCSNVSDRTCPDDQFSCDSQREAGRLHCIPNIYKCDRMCDCDSCEDEQQACPPVNCAPHQFTCAHVPVCISNRFVCDYEDDCGDNSDEENCPPDAECPISKYKCNTTNECLDMAYVCDGIIDCSDSSDEEEAQCNPPSLLCDTGEFQCDNGECIDWKTVCNSEHDCSDGSDELACNVNECEDYSVHQCQQICTNTATSYECSCKLGYKLDPLDGKVCLRVNECRENPGVCDQLCYDRSGPNGYTCRCTSGWTIEPDRSTCKPNDPSEPYLILSNRYYLRTLDIDGGDYSILTDNHLSATYMNVHIPRNKIFYYDSIQQTIDSLNIDGSEREVIVNHTLSGVRGIAVDWIADKLYWTDWSLEEIIVSELNGTNRRTFIANDQNISLPYALASDSTSRYLYWTDVGLNAYVAKIGFDGSKRRMIISDRVVMPISLSVDVSTKRIWWADGHLNYIGYVSDDGTERHIIEAEATTFVHSLDAFGKWIYWTDGDKKSVEKANRFDGGNLTLLRTTLQFPFDIRVWHPQKQPTDGVNECKINNGGCSHLCLLSPDGGRKCDCPNSFQLQPDNMTCLSQCHSSEFQCGRSDDKCIPRYWMCDGEYDCKDGSDEPRDCPKVVCPISQFQCDNSNCVYPWELCDGNDNCGDNSDEGDFCTGCTTLQFQCLSDDTCIPESYQCDGENDCSDGSDENDCNPTCSAEEFTCNNGACVPQTWVCDLDDDCGDGSDENDAVLNCKSQECPFRWFSCESNYRCIPEWQVCNGIDNCRDNSDETTKCPECHPVGDFTCNNGQCIRASYECDFDTDCTDGSDEFLDHCSTRYRNCSESEFRCTKGLCISKKWVCDYDNDCGDLSDENLDICQSTSCPSGLFRCHKGPCISEDLRCNRIWDCADGSDETIDANCQPIACEPNEFSCQNGLCISSNFRCDGQDDCGDNSDEFWQICPNCTNKYQCDNRICISESQKCDGIDNCGDGSDETSSLCNTQETCDPATEFKCDNLKCINKELVCKGGNDCGDMSDQKGCRISCSVNTGGCSTNCTSSPGGESWCECPPGLQISLNDFYSCVDINECLQWSTNKCPQTCKNIKGSYECTCAESFMLQNLPGKTTCAPANNEEFRFFISLANEIRMFVPNQQKQSYSEVQQSGGSIGPMTVDAKLNGYRMLYWADLTAQTIYRAAIPDSIGTQGHPQPVLKNVARVESIAYDWINDLLYYSTSAADSKIVAVSFSPFYTKTVHQRQPDEPGLIAVNPLIGYFYVVYKNYAKGPTIEKISLNGTNATVLVDQAEVFTPTGLTIDYYKDNRVFWCDRKTNQIWTMGANGEDIVRIIASISLGAPVGLEVFAGYLYFLSEANGSLYKMDMFDPTNRTVSMLTGLPKTNSLKLDHRYKLPTGSKNNSCTENMCEHMCLGSMAGPVCVCPDYDRVETPECDPPILNPIDELPPPACYCHNGGSCVTNTQTGAIDCRCVTGYIGERCNETVTTGETPTKQPGAVKATPNTTAVVVPIVVILLVIVIVAIVGAIYFYKKRKAIPITSGGAEFRAGVSDSPPVQYESKHGGIITMHRNVDPYPDGNPPPSAQHDSAFGNPIYLAADEVMGDENLAEVSEVKVDIPDNPAAGVSSL